MSTGWSEPSSAEPVAVTTAAPVNSTRRLPAYSVKMSRQWRSPKAISARRGWYHIAKI